MKKFKIFSDWGRRNPDTITEAELNLRMKNYIKRALPVLTAQVRVFCCTDLGPLLKLRLEYNGGTYINAEAKVIVLGFTKEDLCKPYNVFERDMEDRLAHECGHENSTPFPLYVKYAKKIGTQLTAKAISVYGVPETDALRNAMNGVGNMYCNIFEDGREENIFASNWTAFGPRFMRSNLSVWSKETELPKDAYSRYVRSCLWLSILGHVRPKWIDDVPKGDTLPDLLDALQDVVDNFVDCPTWQEGEKYLDEIYNLSEDYLIAALEDVIKQSPQAQAMQDMLEKFKADFSGTSGKGNPSQGDGSSSGSSRLKGKSSGSGKGKKSKDENSDGEGEDEESKDGKSKGAGSKNGDEKDGSDKGKDGSDGGSDGDGDGDTADGKDGESGKDGKGDEDGEGKSKPEIIAEHEGVTESSGESENDGSSEGPKNLYGDSCKAGGGGSGKGSEEDDYYPEKELEELMAQLDEDAEYAPAMGVAEAEPMTIDEELASAYASMGDRDCINFEERPRTAAPQNPPAEITMKASLIANAINKIKAATEYSKASTSGKLNKRKLTRYATGRYDIFCRKQPAEEGVAAYICWDGSGSMYGLKQTNSGNAVTLIEKAFKGIPLKIINFTTDGRRTIHHLVKDFDEDARAMSYAYGYYRSKGFSGGNKDGYSIRVATRELLERPEKRKILIVLSDGLPSDYSGGFEAGRHDVRKATEEAVKDNIEVISIFFGESHDRQELMKYYKYMYEDGGAQALSCAPEKLGDELVKIFTKIALKRK